MALFKPMSGNRTALNEVEKHSGYVYFCVDDGSLHFDFLDDNGVVQRKQINAKDAETLTGASLSTILNSSDLEIPTSKVVLDKLGTKVDKIDGKGLSTNDFTNEEKEKLNDVGNWAQIYDSGAITSEVNSISNIDVSSFKNLIVAVKCVNTTNSAGTRSGAVIFTGSNSQDYAFNNIFGNLIKNGTTTSGAMAKFKIVDGYIICENAMRAINADGILSDTEGSGCDTLTPLAGGLIKCTSPISTMAVSTAAQSADHYYGVGSRVIVWGCKV